MSMTLTNDMYNAQSKLNRWYKKYSHQIIEISGVIGTGTWEVVQAFIDDIGFDPREIMYLSYDQKQVIELASKRYHAYYLNGIIYKYYRHVDLKSIPGISRYSKEINFRWEKDVRKKIDPKYRLIIVFDSVLLNHQTLSDLGSFGLPIILVRDPGLTPSPDSFTFLKDPNIELRELHPELMKNPIVYFANKALVGDKMTIGSYDTVSVVPKNRMNLYNMKSADMIITMTEDLSNNTNLIYRDKIMKFNPKYNYTGERVIVMNDLYGHKLVNEDEDRIRIYLTKGLVGNISKCNRHAAITKYIPIEFKTDFYYEPFTELYIDRHYLNGVETPSRQIVPDEVLKIRYAYALPVALTRLSHWDKVTVIANDIPECDEAIYQKMLYTAISRARSSMTLIV